MDAVKTTFSHYSFQSPCQNYLPISISTTLPQGSKDRKASCGPYTPDNTFKQAITPPCVKSKARLHALPCNSSTKVPTRESIATKESPAAVGRWIQSSNHAFNTGSSIVCHGCISQLPKSISRSRESRMAHGNPQKSAKRVHRLNGLAYTASDLPKAYVRSLCAIASASCLKSAANGTSVRP